ncbi:MAG: biotin-dependent carboxyltransferase family protein [Acidobacteriota bacterium]|nr:biotin-dependent carboxyltransferase family protein [Acidobacteriota bacterium]
MSVTVLRPGMLTTVQDRGRFGAQHLGVPVAGPMDWWSHDAANRLTGNDPRAATLEVTLIGPELELGRDAIASVVGANFELNVSGRAVVMNRAFAVAAGDRLSFGRRLAGARAYLAVDGGFGVPEVLGSRATHVTAALGGFEGRALQRGDTIPLGSPCPVGAAALEGEPPHLAAGAPCVLRAVPGPDGTPDGFWNRTFTVSPQSDRMGYRLEGAALEVSGDHLSASVAMGTVQATPSGTCVLLMADRATCGGYARVATVITADLPRAGQLAPGDHVRFSPATPSEAAAALAGMRDRLPERAS